MTTSFEPGQYVRAIRNAMAADGTTMLEGSVRRVHELEKRVGRRHSFRTEAGGSPWRQQDFEAVMLNGDIPFGGGDWIAARTRSDRYTFYGHRVDGEFRITAGCRRAKTLEWAYAHWGNPGHRLHEESTRLCLELIRLARLHGWTVGDWVVPDFSERGHIWNEESGWWAAPGCGYVPNKQDAHVYTSGQLPWFVTPNDTFVPLTEEEAPVTPQRPRLARVVEVRDTNGTMPVGTVCEVVSRPGADGTARVRDPRDRSTRTASISGTLHPYRHRVELLPEDTTERVGVPVETPQPAAQDDTRTVNGRTFRIGQRVRCVRLDDDGFGNWVSPGDVLTIKRWNAANKVMFKACERSGSGFDLHCFEPVDDETPQPVPPSTQSPAERLEALMLEAAQRDDDLGVRTRAFLLDAGYTVERQATWRITPPAP